MNITITLTDSATKFIINNLYPLYLHDLSEIWGWHPNKYGIFEDNETMTLSEQDKIFDIWWDKPDILYPYLIKVDDIPAGFALVATPPHTPPGCDFYMNEFFVLRSFRGNGIAEYAAKEVFKCHQGPWEVLTNPNELNKRAQQFWRRTLKEYTNDNHQEECGKSHDDETMMIFRFDNK
jgi:predicted acetyltransferase